MAHGPTNSAGRPGSALLLLGAIFATAVIVRVPLGPAPVEQPNDSTIAARSFDIWSALPIALMDPPSIEAQATPGGNVQQVVHVSPVEPLSVKSTATLIESARHDAATQYPSTLSEPPMLVAEPALALASTPSNHFALLPAAVTPVSFVESSSSPFGAVGTAFAKTGAALTLAFKKTGQGILAPF